MEDLQTAPAAEAVRPMPFTEKLANIFASPGELYENVRDTGPTKSNWLIPSIILILASILMTQIMLSNASLVDQLDRTMRQAMEKSLEGRNMPPEQMERAREQVDAMYERTKPGSTWFVVLSTVGPLFWTFIMLFGLGLAYWLVGKTAMSASAPYMKVAEVVGLTFLIGTLEVIVTTLLMYAMDSIHASPSLALFIKDIDITNKVHLALTKVNVFTIWALVVTGIGLSKLFRRDLPKVLVLVFALWILYCAVTILTGIGAGR
jgi:Yip1 domain